VLAKGVRKPTSRKSGHVELFTYTQLLIAKGRDIDIVTQAETIDPFRLLRDDLLRLTYASYAAELVDRFTGEGIENRPLFDLLLSTLGWIERAGDLDLMMRFFELQLLDRVGYRPQLHNCVQCGTEIKPVANFFSPEAGGVLCPKCGEKAPWSKVASLEALKVLRFLQTRDYSKCRRLHIAPSVHREVELHLQRYVVYFLERNLKSVEFLHTLRRQVQVNE
jgi:DNA repair protein RecO (recombination protein O)